MAQSRVQAKNSFGEGLVMDFSPNNTQANVLSNALNATLLTYNGNEMNLQNDMGNGRVETAFLPTGYMPVGTCELGGVIYIVSYNPQKDLCQIGSFPSPERNIEQDELNQATISPITTDMFQEGYNKDPNKNKYDGNLKTTAVKVVIRNDSLNPGDKYIITTTEASLSENLSCLSGLESTNARKNLKLTVVSIEDSGKITKLNTRNYKVTLDGKDYQYLLSTAEKKNLSGSGVDLDAYRKMVTSNYNVFSSKVSGKLAILAELETISGFSAAHRVITTEDKEKGTLTYEIYLDYSWESDDLSIYPEYITVTGWNWLTPDGEALKSDYTLGTYTLNGKDTEFVNTISYSSDLNLEKVGTETTDPKQNIPVCQLPLTLPQVIDSVQDESYFYHTISSTTHTPTLDFHWEDITYLYSSYKDGVRTIYYTTDGKTQKSIEVGKDAIGELDVAYKLGLSNSVRICKFTVPTTMGGLNYSFPFKLQYTVTPAMKFGLLPQLAITNEIDFSKIGSHTIDLEGVKYYVTQDVLTLAVSSEIYEETNHRVTAVGLEFYDLNGFCGSLSVNNRESYSGTITWSIPLSSTSTISKGLDLTKFQNSDEYYHNLSVGYTNEVQNILGEKIPASGMPLKDYPEGTVDKGRNDCGYLYYGMLYGVKVIYAYSALDAITQKPISNPETITKGFWLYTTGEFNDLYYTQDDFRTIVPEIPLIYSYELQDKTKKSTPVLNEGTRQYLHSLINGKKEEEGTELTTRVTYSGEMDLTVKIGIASGGVYSLINYDNDFTENSRKLSLGAPTVTIGLLSPYENAKKFSVIEAIQENESTDDSEESEVTYYSGNLKEDSLTIKDEDLKTETKTLTLNLDGYSAKAQLSLDLPIEFKVTPTSYKQEVIEATVLTPILYSTSNVDADFNYDDVGGKEMFSTALCYNGNDVATDNVSNSSIGWDSDEHWLKIDIKDKEHYLYTSLKEYPKEVHTDLMSGDPELVSYYSSLGSRQPFTLFAIQVPYTEKLDKDPDDGETDIYNLEQIKYTSGFCSNIYARGNDAEYDFAFDDLATGYILQQGKIKGSADPCQFHTGFKDMPYVPAYITTGIANGEYGVYMSSSGGKEQDCKVKCNTGITKFTSKAIPYTSKTYNELYDSFYQPYLNTLKQMLTVNSDESNIEVKTFEYDKKDLKDYQLVSYLTGYVEGAEKLISNAKYLVAFNGVQYSKIVNATIKRIDEVLSENDPNVNIIFNTDALGSKATSLAPITSITYNMANENDLINDYANPTQMVYTKYINGVSNVGSGQAFTNNWSGNLQEVHTSIDESRFYIQTNNLELQQLNSSAYSTDASGYIQATNGTIHHQIISSSLRYVVGNSPNQNTAIFTGTNMLIEDFIWDPSNDKHHFQFAATSKLNPVAGAYSYQLDNKDGNRTEVIHRKYYIGPSFR